ncbi:unnamed protein product [Boreogadus saida]
MSSTRATLPASTEHAGTQRETSSSESEEMSNEHVIRHTEHTRPRPYMRVTTGHEHGTAVRRRDVFYTVITQHGARRSQRSPELVLCFERRHHFSSNQCKAKSSAVCRHAGSNWIIPGIWERRKEICN